MTAEYANGRTYARRVTDPDRTCRYVLAAVASFAAVAVAAILIFIASEGFGALKEIGLVDFFTGDVWKPHYDSFGALPLFAGTLLVTVGAMAVACPIGIGAALYLSEVASPRVRRFVKPVIEVMAGIPSVVYGFLGLIILVPFLKSLFPNQLLSGASWLAGSILLGIMALPEIVSVSDDALRGVPRDYREASLAVGATRWETTRKVVLPAAASGISAAVILGVGRAIGETMAVMMVTGNTALIPDPAWDVFSTVRTITATLALEIPEAVVGSTQYSVLFLLAFILMMIILAVNLCVKYVLKRSADKFAGRTKETRFSRWADTLDAHRMKETKEMVRIALAAIIVYMAASMFVGVLPSIAIAVCSVVLWKIAENISARHIKRKSRQLLAHSLLSLTAWAIIALLVGIIAYIFIEALPSLSWEFLTEGPKDGCTAGGVFPAIVGSLELLAGTAVISIVIGVLAGVYLAEYGGNGKVTRTVTTAVDVLNGTPSIIFGLFGLVFAVTYLGLGYSLLAGSITMGIMVLPVIIRTTQEAILRVPDGLREASRAIGATKAQTTFKVVLPAAAGGVVTGIILSLARAIGETAPIMFTAVVIQASVSDYSLTSPVMALPYYLYYLATEGRADPSMMYATALVLIAIVLAMFLLASLVRIHSEKKMMQ